MKGKPVVIDCSPPPIPTEEEVRKFKEKSRLTATAAAVPSRPPSRMAQERHAKPRANPRGFVFLAKKRIPVSNRLGSPPFASSTLYAWQRKASVHTH